MSFSLKPFNKVQKQAITYGKGSLLVISGAGTGKTHVLTGRILYLILEKKIPPEQILAITFTEKAAQEMNERLDETLPLGTGEILVKTFHAFCDLVLHERGVEIGLSPDYKLLQDADLWLFLKQHALDFKLKYYRSLTNPQKFLIALQEHFSRLQDEDITPEAYLTYAQKSIRKAKNDEEREMATKRLELANAYAIYENILTKKGYMDFGGLLFYTLRLFEKRASVLAAYQNRFRYILVDEFQDTNFAQNKIVTLLAEKHRNLFVVGDDDQAIYKWRGASLTNIQYFQKHFPLAKEIVLRENYRSHQGILDLSYSIIQNNNPNRLEKTQAVDKRLIAAHHKKSSPPEVYHFPTFDEETDFIIKKAKKSLTAGKSTAILARTNSLASALVEKMKKNYLPINAPSSVFFFTKPAIKDGIALLHVLANLSNDLALFRFLSCTCWDIPMENILEIHNQARTKNLSLFSCISGPYFDPLKNLLKKLIEYSRTHSVSEVLGKFFQESGYLTRATERYSEESDTLDAIAIFSEKVKEFEERHPQNKSVMDFLEFLKLLEESPLQKNEPSAFDPTALQILTIHAAKGLEFDTVFLPGLVAWKFPVMARREVFEVPEELIQESLPSGNHHLEEERRLFYVGLTRAKEFLTLSYSDFYDGKKKWKPSLFINEALESGKAMFVSPRARKNKGLKISRTTSLFDQKPQYQLHLPKLSYSKLATFRTCPLKYQFRYLFQIPTPLPAVVNFGSSIHNTLRDFYTSLQKEPQKIYDDLLPCLLQFLEKNWIPYGYETRALQEEQKRVARELLERFYKNEKEDLTIPAFIEKSFTLVLGDITLTGRIDRIDKLSDGTYEVIDYKTGNNSGKNLKNDLQLSLYSLACRDVLKIPVSRLSLYYLHGLEKISTTRSDEDLEICKEEILECARDLATSDFSPTPGYHCRFCDFRLLCPAALIVK